VSSSPFHRAILVAALSVVALLAGTASASAATYYLQTTKTAPSTHCYAGYGYVDLSQVFPSGASATFAGQARFACTQPFVNGATLNPGPGKVTAWFTNTGKKSCTTSWFLNHNATSTHAGENIAGTYYDGGQPFVVPAGTKTPKQFTANFTLDETTVLPPGDQLELWINTRTASGSCSAMTLYYAGGTTPTNIDLPTLVVPSA
jgi:hypothetical protein